MGRPDEEERRRRARRRALEESRRGHPVGRELPSAALPPVVARVTEVVRSGSPLALLLELSSLLGEVGHAGSEVDARWLVGLLIEHEDQVTSTCLAVLEQLVADDLLRARVRRELRLRVDPVPDWVARLPRSVTLVDREGDLVTMLLRDPRDDEVVAHLQAVVDEQGSVVDGRVVPSSPRSAWPGCAHLVRWAAGVASEVPAS